VFGVGRGAQLEAYLAANGHRIPATPGLIQPDNARSNGPCSRVQHHRATRSDRLVLKQVCRKIRPWFLLIPRHLRPRYCGQIAATITGNLVPAAGDARARRYRPVRRGLSRLHVSRDRPPAAAAAQVDPRKSRAGCRMGGSP
jgi:hypothetical protein